MYNRNVNIHTDKSIESVTVDVRYYRLNVFVFIIVYMLIIKHKTCTKQTSVITSTISLIKTNNMFTNNKKEYQLKLYFVIY